MKLVAAIAFGFVLGFSFSAFAIQTGVLGYLLSPGVVQPVTTATPLPTISN